VITELVQRVVARWAEEQGWEEVPAVRLERPAEEVHGDYATPLCMQLARTAKKSPRILAEDLRARLLADAEVARLVERIEVAGPGFLNFTLSGAAYSEAMAGMLAEGDQIGRGSERPHPWVNLEFVSVNPNGPLHVGHGRYAAYGDALHRLMGFSGAKVSTEFYINDYGRQMDRFGRSVAARYAQSFGLCLPVPADGYQGEYVKDVAATVRAEVGETYLPALTLAVAAAAAAPLEDAPPAPLEAEDAAAPLEAEDEEADEAEAAPDWPADPAVDEAITFFRKRACVLMLEEMRAELAAFRVEFDTWFSETSLHVGGALDRVIGDLLDRGEAYEEGGAVWLRTTSRGDDKDRVLIRGNGRPTYFAADIAYHENKLERGFEHLINIWGADHHGYVPRMKAAVEILAGRPGALEVIIGQLVNLLEQGELRQMSTRRGEMVTLAELVEAIGVDAARFFLVMRSHDQTLDLDLGLARQQSQENPVYYVQYAHARIASILRNIRGETRPAIPDDQAVFASPYERALIKRLETFAWIVQDAAERRAPHRIAAYAQELAADFHVFYKHCRVIGVAPAEAASRLALCLVTRSVIYRCLEMLGVSAPESM
jgi:arginyl-tRNA synthetase